MKQIAFPLSVQPNELTVSYSDTKPIDFPADLWQGAIRFPFEMTDPAVVREVLFRLQRDNNAVPFGLRDRLVDGARLGSLDPFMIGTLDGMTLDFKVWANTNELLFDFVPGADGNIFDFTSPLREDFPYRTSPFTMTMDLGKYFMGGYGHIPAKLYMYIRNGVPGSLPYPDAQTDIFGTNMRQHLKHFEAELLSSFVLYCKSVFGLKVRLGEIDPWTLGELDPYPLGRITRDTAAVMRLQASSPMSLSNGIEVAPKNMVQLQISTTSMNPDKSVGLQPALQHPTLISMRSRRVAMLGDMDDKTIGRLDECRLNVRYFGKIPAIVTVDAET